MLYLNMTITMTIGWTHKVAKNAMKLVRNVVVFMIVINVCYNKINKQIGVYK